MEVRVMVLTLASSDIEALVKAHVEKLQIGTIEGINFTRRKDGKVDAEVTVSTSTNEVSEAAESVVD